MTSNAAGPARFDPESGEFLGADDGAWKVPATISPALIAECRSALGELDRYLAPAPPAQTIARVMTLLEHYYVADRDPKVQRALAYDWNEDVGEFPEWAIHEAARKWRRTEHRRPTPGDIRDICQRLTREPVRNRQRLRETIRANEQGPAGNVVTLPALRRMGEV